jgi:hypothetical protein
MPDTATPIPAHPSWLVLTVPGAREASGGSEVRLGSNLSMAPLIVVLPDMLAATAPQTAISISTSASPLDIVISVSELGLRDQTSLNGQ